jgi:hypothetical protein
MKECRTPPSEQQTFLNFRRITGSCGLTMLIPNPVKPQFYIFCGDNLKMA